MTNLDGSLEQDHVARGPAHPPWSGPRPSVPGQAHGHAGDSAQILRRESAQLGRRRGAASRAVRGGPDSSNVVESECELRAGLHSATPRAAAAASGPPGRRRWGTPSRRGRMISGINSAHTPCPSHTIQSTISRLLIASLGARHRRGAQAAADRHSGSARARRGGTDLVAEDGERACGESDDAIGIAAAASTGDLLQPAREALQVVRLVPSGRDAFHGVGDHAQPWVHGPHCPRSHRRGTRGCVPTP